MALQHLRSSTANKRPLPAGMSDGQLAINTNLASPGLFFKDSNGDLVKVGPVHVGTTAPNVSPASGGQTGNTTGELWLDTSVSPNQLKTWNGSSWVSDFPDEIPVAKLADGASRQLLQTDAAGTGVEWTSNVDVPGTLDVTSTATFDSIASHPLGTAGAPTITFTGDTNTGIYSPGADQLALATNGTGRLFVDANGSIGAGTTSVAGYNLRLSKNLTGGAGFPRGASVISTVQSDATGNAWAFQSEVGVQDATFTLPELVHFYARQGTKGASATLTNQYGFNVASSLTGGTNNYGFYSNIASGTGRWNFYAAGTADNFFNGGNTIFQRGASEVMRITSDGKVGVGTSSPSQRFEVGGGNIKLTGSTSQPFTGYWGSGDNSAIFLPYGYLGSNGAFAVSLYSNGYRDTSPGFTYLGINGNTSTACGLDLQPNGDIFFRSGTATGTALPTRMFINSSGNVGIGTTTPSQLLQVNGNALIGATPAAQYSNFTVVGDSAIQAAAPLLNLVNAAGSTRFGYLNHTGTGGNFYLLNQENGALQLGTNNLERARIDSSGRLLVGTSSARSNYADVPSVQLEGTNGSTSSAQILRNSNDGGGALLYLGKTRGTAIGGTTIVQSADDLGSIRFLGHDGTQPIPAAQIVASVDGTPGANDMPGRLVFSTTADGASSPTERMRIQARGDVLINTTTQDVAFTNGVGASFSSTGLLEISQTGPALKVNRKTTDGNIIEILQDGTTEGSISVSGTTVSYNGAHLSRWSQLPGGAERTEILRGTVLSNIDEMCGWGEEANEQLNRMKVSDVEGDANVAGVFQDWDDDDDTYTNDFYCAMTGDFIIRIAAGTPVHKGQLLMSAGDGTAKPQDDDIVRSKTVAKVTSNHVACTYDDGSYCVPCVLMAC